MFDVRIDVRIVALYLDWYDDHVITRKGKVFIQFLLTTIIIMISIDIRICEKGL